MNGNDIIYPSDVKAAREAAIARTPADKNGFSAMRINFTGVKTPKGGRVTYYPWEINLADGRGWKKMDKLYFMNLKHVGKVAELSERLKSQKQIMDIALLFKGDYTYERIKTVNGQKVKVIEEYGKEKEWLSRAFVAHVKKHQAKSELSPSAKINVNIKDTREVKKDGKITYEKVIPSNINVSIPFNIIDSNDAMKKEPKTKFKCEILDVERKKASFDPKKDWPFEPAKARYSVKTDDGVHEVVEDLDNSNIHRFLRGGSECSGFDNMGDVCISGMGISNPSKVQVLMVKQSQQQAVNPSSISDDDWAAIGGGATPSVGSGSGSGAVSSSVTVEVPMPDGSMAEVSSATESVADDGGFGDGFDTSAGTGETFDF